MVLHALKVLNGPVFIGPISVLTSFFRYIGSNGMYHASGLIPYHGMMKSGTNAAPHISPHTYSQTCSSFLQLNITGDAMTRAGFRAAPVNDPPAIALANNDSPIIMGPVLPYPFLCVVYQTTANIGSMKVNVRNASHPNIWMCDRLSLGTKHPLSC